MFMDDDFQKAVGNKDVEVLGSIYVRTTSLRWRSGDKTVRELLRSAKPRAVPGDSPGLKERRWWDGLRAKIDTGWSSGVGVDVQRTTLSGGDDVSTRGLVDEAGDGGGGDGDGEAYKQWQTAVRPSVLCKPIESTFIPKRSSVQVTQAVSPAENTASTWTHFLSGPAF
ncbi:uncharacterized protein GLRG_05934 [Colletotrichum graminicola M1.001]|uniref:Uncharacterized protein n=1 Tax=Colletotrichum graminicola (strain M1.001 / M2 / FGSC 10212) TaxID=645133 RepID=E3QIV2_COLGM|nr:uncharacterized protein GLRG_05934 [Colletotrichum graminicola M1.001]EFQ30790.1 hypothetical protein GLRG_05934 [Colletotrichum graminicola M1.001]